MTAMRSRWAAVGAAVAVTLGAGGISLGQAAISSGDKPVFVGIEPCRLVDTRPGDNNIGGRTQPLGANDTLTLQITGSTGECSGIPADATAAAMNVTAIQGSTRSFLTIYPADTDLPLASNLNWNGGDPPTPNKVDVKLGTTGADAGKINLTNSVGTVHVAADLVGYYTDHTHDDRYYTKTQVFTQAETVSIATPRVTTIEYDEITVGPQLNQESAAKLRDVGTFTTSGGTVKITWTSHGSSSNTSCGFGIRVDGLASSPWDDGLSRTDAILIGVVDAPFTTVDVFEGLPAGTHDLDIFYRSLNSSCTENPGGFGRQILIEEYPD